MNRQEAAKRFAHVDRLLSEAQGHIGGLVNIEVKDIHPTLYRRASKIWDELERVRKELRARL